MKPRPLLLILLLFMLVTPSRSHAATTYTWNAQTTSPWVLPANWTPQRITPAADDVLVFDGAFVPATTVTEVPNETIGQLGR